MKIYKENYGADADGNRGQWITEYEIDEDDRDAIIDQLEFLKEDLGEEEELPRVVEIALTCPYSDELITFEIDTEDYL